MEQHESVIQAFDQKWAGGAVPPIEEHLPSGQDPQQYRSLLVELISVDLEYRWRNALPKKVSEYLIQFPELAKQDEFSLELIGEEYRVRHRWGDRPTHSEFESLKGFHEREISALLSRIDEELRCEEDHALPHIQADATERLGKSTFESPLRYDDYVLRQMIGAGRMGKVYRAWHRKGERLVAVKYLRKSFLKYAEAVERFVREAHSVSRLEHPRIVHVHGIGRTPGGGYFIVMDLVTGGDLEHWLGPTKNSVSQVGAWMIQSCDALRHSHDAGIIHCDLKPANLLLDEKSKILVTDFGLARWLSEKDHAVDRIEGTAATIAPEQVSRWWGPMTPRTDVYGLGAVFYLLLTGRAPHDGKTITDVLARVVSGVDIVPPQEFRTNIPERVSEVCLRCLAKAPKDRFADMSALQKALVAAFDSLLVGTDSK